MDTFTTSVGLLTMFLTFMGEHFRAGVYLWLAAIFAIIFALRMAEPMFYMGTAGFLAVLVFRILSSEDVRNDDE